MLAASGEELARQEALVATLAAGGEEMGSGAACHSKPTKHRHQGSQHVHLCYNKGIFQH